MLKKCIHKGGTDCLKAGGNGSWKHASTYVHKYPNTQELGPGEPSNRQDSGHSVLSKSLESWFNDEVAEKALSQNVSTMVDSVSMVKKSLYDFNINTIEGVDKIIYLLPIADDKVIELVAQELWPGYPIDENIDHKKLRYEIKGFLLDLLYEYEERFNATGETVFDKPEATEEPEQAGADTDGDVPDTDQQAGDQEDPTV